MTDDPIALRSPAMCRFFAGVMRRQVAGHFRALRMLRPGLPELPADAPLIVYSNHPGWWDPAVCIALHDAQFPGREGYAPMEAEAIERYGFMKRIGLFGIEPDSRAGAVRFLKVGQAVLSDPRRMLWVTAQGRFADPRERPLRLRAGVAALMARVPGAVALPLALEYPFWSEKRPEALLAYGAPQREASEDALEEALAGTMDRLAEAAMRREPAAFEDVARGRQGVGGVYGLWSRLRAKAAGRAYVAEHMAEDRTP